MRYRTIRRVALWLALAAAVPPVLVGSYVGAWLLFTWWATPAVRPADPYMGVYVMHPAFGPIDDYIVADRPGSELLLRLHCVADPNCD